MSDVEIRWYASREDLLSKRPELESQIPSTHSIPGYPPKAYCVASTADGLVDGLSQITPDLINPDVYVQHEAFRAACERAARLDLADRLSD